MGRSVKISNSLLDSIAKKASVKQGEGTVGLTAACLALEVNYGSCLARAKKVGHKGVLNQIAKYAARDISKTKKTVKAVKVKKVVGKKPKTQKTPKVSVPSTPTAIPPTDSTQTLQVSEAQQIKETVPA